MNPSKTEQKTLNTEVISQQEREQQALEQRRTRLKDVSARLIEMASNEPHSALRCIHQLSVAGGATEATYLAIEQRVMADNDTAGAYHLALLAQSTLDLPIDVRRLIELVVEKGDNLQRLALLKNLPLPPVDAIKAQIVASNDKDAIAQMNTYLQANPQGHGSEHMLSSGQSDQIVPLS